MFVRLPRTHMVYVRHIFKSIMSRSGSAMKHGDEFLSVIEPRPPCYIGWITKSSAIVDVTTTKLINKVRIYNID